MRILQLDTGKEMRGGQWQVLRLTEGLAIAGIESTILARAGGELFSNARLHGRRVAPISLARVAMLARSHDVIHAHDAHAHTLAAIARFAPLIVSRRVAFPIRSEWKYGRAHEFLAVSHFVKRVLTDGGVPNGKIRVVYDGVPLMEEAVGTAILVPPNAADPMKGGKLVQEAAKLAGVELRIATSMERDVLNAGMCLYITQSEGLGSAALLAMSAGVPVIASNVGGLPEIIQHDVNGLLVENNASAIAGAIRELAEDPERARRLGRAGRQTVTERFAVHQMVAGTLEAYRQVFA
jgi:hypothetical protein